MALGGVAPGGGCGFTAGDEEGLGCGPCPFGRLLKCPGAPAGDCAGGGWGVPG